MTRKINFSLEDTINALEDYARKHKKIDEKETMETITFNYDEDNNVISIDTESKTNEKIIIIVHRNNLFNSNY